MKSIYFHHFMSIKPIFNLQVWQAFVGARKRRVDNYYQNLLDKGIEAGQVQNKTQSSEKLRKQIEKVIRHGPWTLSYNIFHL